MKLLHLSLAVILGCISLPLYAVTGLLVNYTQLVKALEGGDDVKAIIHFDRCLVNDRAFQRQYVQELDGASTRMNFTEFKRYKFRDNDQLRDNVEASENFSGFALTPTIVINNAILRVFDDNTAKLYVNIYDHNGVILFNLIWTCEISSGIDEKGLRLFNDP